MRKEDGEFLGGDLVLLQEVAAEGGEIATNDKCGADESELCVRDGGGGGIERDILKREAEKREKGFCADMGNGWDSFG